MPNNDHDVEYRVVHANGSMVTGVLNMGQGGDSDIQPSISAGVGDASLPGDFWTVVWNRDANDNGRGQIMGRRIYYTGSENVSSDVFSVTSDLDKGANPSVTSNMTKWLSYEPDTEVAIIACEWHEPDFTRPEGTQSDIVLMLLLDDLSITGLHLTWSEDFDRSLHQRNPVVVTAGGSQWDSATWDTATWGN